MDMTLLWELRCSSCNKLLGVLTLKDRNDAGEVTACLKTVLSGLDIKCPRCKSINNFSSRRKLQHHKAASGELAAGDGGGQGGGG